VHERFEPHWAHSCPPVPHWAFLVPGRHVLPWLQQPFGQEAASQTQVPFRQRWPLEQAAVAPQVQAPAAEQASAIIGSQATQVPPALPQAAVDDVVQMPLAQQPLGQDCALHTQRPPTQTTPEPQAAVAPHRQVPVASQLSARLPSQAIQVPPPAAQAAGPSVLQVPPAQQPFGQVWASHVQAPATHSEPAPQAGPTPHEHAPTVEQLSARVGSQLAQVAPARPHDEALRGDVHIPSAQHPLGQDPALQPAHAPPLQACPPQSWQATPPIPHWVPLVPAMQFVPAQQPPAHDVASHTQEPATQRWPETQGATSPHLQVPIVQRSAPTPHTLQAAPPAPHASVAGVRQVLPTQHPAAHDVRSHTQLPPTQR